MTNGEPVRTMTQPTREQWDLIAEKLDRQLDPVYLRCDGHLVSAVMARTGKNQLGIAVVVNGWRFKGEWLPLDGRGMSEEARRFWRPKRRARMSRKQLKLWEKLEGKRECRRRGYYDPLIWPEPVWLRPRPFIRHLKEHNEHIEIIDYETYRREVDALHAADRNTEQNR